MLVSIYELFRLHTQRDWSKSHLVASTKLGIVRSSVLKRRKSSEILRLRGFLDLLDLSIIAVEAFYHF